MLDAELEVLVIAEASSVDELDGGVEALAAGIRGPETGNTRSPHPSSAPACRRSCATGRAWSNGQGRAATVVRVDSLRATPTGRPLADATFKVGAALVPCPPISVCCLA